MNVLSSPQSIDVLDVPFKHKPTMTLHYHEGKMTRDSRNVICEREFSIYANDEHLVNLVCSQAALRELAYGFLYSEQIITSLDDVDCCIIDENSMTASFILKIPVIKPSCITVSSGFGGKVFLSNQSYLQKRYTLISCDEPGSVLQGTLTNNLVDKVAWVIDAVDEMNDYALAYAATRGIHCSALFLESSLVACFEDIGRHNTFDKLTGYCLLQGCSTRGMFLTTTGRISAEMMRKALRIGVYGVASYSGPTDAAVSRAQENNMLMVGYVGKSSATIYSGMK